MPYSYNEPDSEIYEIARLTHMAVPKPPPQFFGSPNIIEDHSPAKKPKIGITKERTIGPYAVALIRKGGSIKVNLYENLEGWKRSLRLTWSAIELGEAVVKFEQVYEVAKRVRAERIIAQRRALGYYNKIE